MDNIEEIKKELKEAKKNVPISRYTTIKIGGRAHLSTTVYKKEDLIRIVRKALELEIPYLVLGKGSNVVIADENFSGLLIINETAEVIGESTEAVADSGITLGHLIRRLAESGLGGLNFLAGIPGTLGGAIYGNAGAYGKYMSDITLGVVVLDTDSQVKQIDNKSLGFGYRTSIFKKQSNQSNFYKRPVILSARLKVHRATKEGILRVVNNYEKMREKKYPKYPSAGSFFKNIIVSTDQKLPKEIKLAQIEGKIPAGFLIERAGAKGSRVGGAMVSSEHANFIINRRGAKASDVKKLVQEIKEKVRETFGVELEEEVEFIGDIDTTPKGIWKKLLKK